MISLFEPFTTAVLKEYQAICDDGGFGLVEELEKLVFLYLC